LAKLSSIGSLILWSTQLSALVGLTGAVVSGEIQIYGNDSLTDLDGLTPAATVESVFIQENDKLTNIDTLSNITSVNDFIIIEYNNALTNVDGPLSINSNPILCQSLVAAFFAGVSAYSESAVDNDDGC
jgi:hypothetical protein